MVLSNDDEVLVKVFSQKTHTLLACSIFSERGLTFTFAYAVARQSVCLPVCL